MSNLKKIIGLFFIMSSILSADIKGIKTESVFKDTVEESKIRTLAENAEACLVIDEILKSETLAEREKELLIKKADYFKKIYTDNFELYYNKKKAEEILKRENIGEFEKNVIKIMIENGKESLGKKYELKDEKNDSNYIFYMGYFAELRRLILLSPKVTSEIETLSEKEKQGFDLNNRTAVLTFDDGPSENTKELLTYLKAEEIKAVFFVQGSNIEEREDAVKTLKNEIEQGHEIGIHSLTHARLKNLNEKKVYKEITYPKELIEKKTGYKPKFYRTPFGSRDKEALNEIEKRYIANVLWNIDSQDWRSNFTGEMVKERVVKLTHLYNGGIILFHDTNKKSTKIMPEILKSLKNSGFEFKTLSEVYQK
jgi:peptidoglycan-N-acetylglucosamine deacetylase